MGTVTLSLSGCVSEIVKETVPSRPIILLEQIIGYWQTPPTQCWVDHTIQCTILYRGTSMISLITGRCAWPVSSYADVCWVGAPASSIGVPRNIATFPSFWMLSLMVEVR